MAKPKDKVLVSQTNKWLMPLVCKKSDFKKYNKT
jgi:hypothetical protein